MKKMTNQSFDVTRFMGELKEIAEQESFRTQSDTIERILQKYEMKLKEVVTVESFSTQAQ